MRKVLIGTPPGGVARVQDPVIKWLIDAVLDIQRASHEQITDEIADAFTVENDSLVRALDPTTATAEDVGNVLATLLRDMKDRGVKRGA